MYAYVHKAHITPPAERDDAKYTFRKTMVGPFKVTRAVGPNAFELDLPRASYPNAPLVFNVSALEPELNAQPGEPAFDGNDHSTTGPDGSPTYVIERVLRHKVRNRRRYWLIRWKHYTSAHDTWEPLANLATDGTAATPLLAFEQARLGDCRHADPTAPPVAYPTGASGHTAQHADGWVLHHCFNNATPTSIARDTNTTIAEILDYNVDIIAGLTKKSKLQRGTAVRITPPTPPS